MRKRGFVFLMFVLIFSSGFVLAADGDGDGVDDAIDNCLITPNANQQDTDGDGLGNVCDYIPVTEFASCPGDANGDSTVGTVDNNIITLNWGVCTENVAGGEPCKGDVNGNGIVDSSDSQVVTLNWGLCPNADPDQDGIVNSNDACPYDADNDADSDGFCGDVDNCPNNSNPGQEDGDGDGVGDVCDNCPVNSNVNQADNDGDGLGNSCEVCDNDVDNDADSDGFCGDVDNCPSVANANQADADGDGIGDVCDSGPGDDNNQSDDGMDDDSDMDGDDGGDDGSDDGGSDEESIIFNAAEPLGLGDVISAGNIPSNSKINFDVVYEGVASSHTLGIIQVGSTSIVFTIDSGPQLSVGIGEQESVDLFDKVTIVVELENIANGEADINIFAVQKGDSFFGEMSSGNLIWLWVGLGAAILVIVIIVVVVAIKSHLEDKTIMEESNVRYVGSE